ncbi:hypothetical protein L917_01349 [Phytophthora nicotianae]|uniref:Uncharacterized protein n=1 Tax=Phytophthora nicotianae TaxID=4792 RepID=W2LZY4_PHYNI|nr:hypothetical protein L917_01349 [Phytophthora nicotianae]
MRDQLRPMLDAVKEKHPSLSVNVSLFGREGDIFNWIDMLTSNWRAEESSHKNELFFDYVEEQTVHDTYFDPLTYEIVSKNEGDDEGEVEERDNELVVRGLLLFRAMARLMNGVREGD